MALPDRRFMLSIVVITKELYWVSDGNTPTPNLFLIFSAMPHVVSVTCDHRISEFVSFQSCRISSTLLTLEVKNQRLTTAYSATDDDKLRANIDTAVNRHSKLSGEDGNDSHFLLLLLLVLKWIRLFLSVSRLLLTTAVCVVRVLFVLVFVSKTDFRFCVVPEQIHIEFRRSTQNTLAKVFLLAVRSSSVHSHLIGSHHNNTKPHRYTQSRKTMNR